jgi:hypothetical protein
MKQMLPLFITAVTYVKVAVYVGIGQGSDVSWDARRTNRLCGTTSPGLRDHTRR